MTSSKNGGEKGQTIDADMAHVDLPSSPSPNGVSGQVRHADKALGLSPETPPNDSSGLSTPADKAVESAPELSPIDGKGPQPVAGVAIAHVPDPSPIDRLAELQVRRKFYISVTNKQTNAAKALVRRALGYSAGDEEESRKKHAARATRIVDVALKCKPKDKTNEALIAAITEDVSALAGDELARGIAIDLAVVHKGLKPFTEARHGIELAMERAARKMPVHEWQKGVVGFGERALAVIVGEAGDLSAYPKKGHLWKRLGLAPVYGKACSTWRREGGLTAEQWKDGGPDGPKYSPRRRAEIYALVSEPLFKHQTMRQGPYRAIYDRRRALTAQTHPDWTPMHSHMDALRVMTKALIRDLWREWNRREAPVVEPDRAAYRLPTGDTNEREAVGTMPISAKVDMPPARPSTDHREASKRAPIEGASRQMPLGDTTIGAP